MSVHKPVGGILHAVRSTKRRSNEKTVVKASYPVRVMRVGAVKDAKEKDRLHKVDDGLEEDATVTRYAELIPSLARLEVIKP